MSVHYQFTDEVSLIIKNNLFLLNEEQINYIYYGGNRKLLEFINYEFPKLQNFQPEIFYKTQAMQFYRDNLYYLVEGGEKPIRPNDNFAYKLVNNMINYPLTEKREKNYYFGDKNQPNKNNNLDDSYNDSNNYDDDLKEEDNMNISLEENANINKNLKDIITTENNVIIPLNKQSNSYFYNSSNKKTENYLNNSPKINETENLNILTNNNSKDNFYQKKEKFFNEMNRLFGGYNKELNEELNNNIYNDMNRTYKVKRPKVNFNYNNYIKNTININNNNTNIILEDDMNKNIFSKSQMISLDNNISNFNKNKYMNKTTHTNIRKNNDNISLYNNSEIIEAIDKKNKSNFSKKVFIFVIKI